MTGNEQTRLIDYLRNRMCGPCRESLAPPTHKGCTEALELTRIVEREKPSNRS